MAWRMDTGSRDRGLLLVRLATAGGALGAIGLSLAFADMAEAYFSGRPAPTPAPPRVPQAPAPVQATPEVVTTVVRHPYQAGAPANSAPRAPSQAPAPALAPPPAPACHSTPSHPC